MLMKKKCVFCWDNIDCSFNYTFIFIHDILKIRIKIKNTLSVIQHAKIDPDPTRQHSMKDGSVVYSP